jgi:dCMP deaminase
VLGRSLASEFSSLARDMRAMSPEKVLAQAKAISLAPDINILEKDTVSELDKFDEIVISDDEVGHELHKKYFPNKKVTVDNTFLRWSNMAAVTKDVPKEDLVVSSEDLDRELINQAYENAKKSPDWWRQVGSLIFKDGEILLNGNNIHLPTNNSAYIDGDPRSSFNAGERIDLSLALHGEAVMIAEAAKKGIPLEGTSIYLTVRG